MKLKYNDALKGKIPADALTAAEKAIADIKSGTFVVPVRARSGEVVDPSPGAPFPGLLAAPDNAG